MRFGGGGGRAAAVVCVGGATVAAVAFSVLRRKAVFEDEFEAGDDDDVEELPEVPAEIVIQIFNKLCGLMNAHLTQVMRRINAQGAQVPQQMLAQYLVEHFEQQLRELQARVFKEFGVTEEAVEEAVEYYETLVDDTSSGNTTMMAPRDPNVVEATNQLRQLYINVGGSIDLDLPADLTVDKMCTVFEDYMAAVQAAQRAFTEHLYQIKAKGTSVTSNDLQEARQAKIQEKVGVVLKKHGLSSLVFQAALDKFNDHPTFQAAVQAVKAKEQQQQQQQQHAQASQASSAAAASGRGGGSASHDRAAAGGTGPSHGNKR